VPLVLYLSTRLHNHNQYLIYDCNKLNNEREKLIAHISKEDKLANKKK